MDDWHVYAIDWQRDHVCFRIDSQMVLEHAPSPRGPLCFVLWLDNQYAVVTPWANLGWGLIEHAEQQWLEVDWIAIERIADA